MKSWTPPLHSAIRVVIVCLFILGLLVVGIALPVQAATLTVTNANDSGAGSLRQAVLDALVGDTIDFDSSLTGATITLSTPINLNKNLTIDGSSVNAHIQISGGDSTRVFTISSGVTVVIDHLDITNGSEVNGAGIYNEGTLTITHCNFLDNIASGSGGGIYSNNGSLTISSSTFSNNSAGSLGGAVRNLGPSTISNSTFAGNTAGNDGGGVYTGIDTLTIKNSTFAENSATRWGGGIYNSTLTTINLSNNIFADSPSGGDCHNDGAIGTNTNNLIEDGSCSPALLGDPQLGALEFNGGATRTIALGSSSNAIDAGDGPTCESTDQRGVSRPQGTQCDIGSYEANKQDIVNSLNDPGDGNCNASECTLREVIASVSDSTTVTFDSSLSGGTITLASEILIDKGLTLDGASLATPIQISGGSSVRVFTTKSVSRAHIENLEIIDGNAFRGGGVFNTGLLTISESTISGNSATYGGGIHNQGAVTIRRSTIYSNSAPKGSGIDNEGVVQIENSTMINSINNTGSAWVSNSTITSIDNDGNLNMENSLLTNCVNTGLILTNNHNMVESGTCNPYRSGNAFLGFLADNGGPTQTRTLPGFSPAVNSGDDATCLPTDQRGIPRPQWAHCDIGAYEYIPTLAQTVNSTADSGDGTCDVSECTLREALSSLDVGGVVTFEPSLAGQTIILGSGISLGGDVTIDGAGLDPAIRISGGNSVYVMRVSNSTASVTLNQLDIIDGASPLGGVDNEGTLTITNCTFAGNVGDAGAAIGNDGGTLVVDDSTFTNNTADYGGAISNSSGIATIANSTFYNNDATSYGGALRNQYGSMTISNSTISGNAAPGGGGIYNGPSGTLHLKNSIIADSASGGDCYSSSVLATSTNNHIEDGTCGTIVAGDPALGSLSGNGGPTQTMALLPGSPAIDAGDDGTCESMDQRGAGRPSGTHCDIGAFEYPSLLEVNSDADPGDGICNESECTLREAVAIAASGDTVTFNPALANGTILLGSEIALDKDLTIDGSGLTPHVEVSGGDSVRIFLANRGGNVDIHNLNLIDGYADIGGAIANSDGGNLTLSNCTLDGNNADTGGAINNNASLTINDCTFIDNHAVSYGGAINNYQGTVNISGSTFSTNTTDDIGGVAFNTGGPMTIANSTLHDNSAVYGGGIINYLGTLTLSNSTLSGNTASVESGGIGNAPGSTLHMSNTIIAGSSSGGDCVNTGTLATNMNNLIEDGTCSPTLSGDPILGPLGDNGGPTETIALLPGSPAIDVGFGLACSISPVDGVDQRGVARPIDGDLDGTPACDIGAYEKTIDLFLPLITR